MAKTSKITGQQFRENCNPILGLVCDAGKMARGNKVAHVEYGQMHR